MASTPQLSSSEQLSFRPALFAMTVIAIIISLGILIALYFNEQRKSQIIASYDQETTSFIQSHPDGIKKLFSETFDTCQKQLTDKQASESAMYKSSDLICQPAQEVLAELNVNNLKDSSAIAYVKYDNGNYQLIEASGKYNQQSSVINPSSYSHFNYDQEKRSALNEYFTNQSDFDRWQDFIMYIQGKEVVVPVVIDGETLGFIFRGVIEK